MPDVQIVPVDALSEDPEQRRLLTGLVGAHTAASRAVFGDEHSGWTEAELRGKRAVPGYRFVDRVALDGGDVVGMTALAMPSQDNLSLAFLMLAVLPERRREGIGSMLLDDALASARAAGRTVVQADTEWVAGAQDESGQFFAAPRGFVDAQTTVRSAMPLPAEAELLRAYAGGDGVEDAAAFTVETAWDLPPQEWLADLAVLEQRMSTDAPLGETSFEEEVWDVARVERNYRWAADAGRRSLTAVARDGSTGGLVAFTVLQVPGHEPTLAYQHDTLVLREARGNRLGLRVKAAAALELQQTLPQVTRVRTWNADDNRHMLAVNTELGYRPEGYLRVWERRLH